MKCLIITDARYKHEDCEQAIDGLYIYMCVCVCVCVCVKHNSTFTLFHEVNFRSLIPCLISDLCNISEVFIFDFRFAL